MINIINKKMHSFYIDSTFSLTYHFHIYKISTRGINGRCHSDLASIRSGSVEMYITQFDCRAITRILEKNNDIVALYSNIQRDFV